MLLPVGTEDFARVIDKKLDFVDKTLFIKDVFDDKSTDALVFTRPRRFGKTFNLSMLRYFLSAKVGDRVTKGLFDNLKIAKCGNEYLKHQGKYPVISITFKSIDASNYESAKAEIAKLLSQLYFEHQEDLLSSTKLTDEHKNYFLKILRSEANESELKSAIQDLTYYLYLHHEVKPWLLIDEYDTPIQSAYAKNYYDEMIEFMRGIFGSALKTNLYLEKAVITGILRVAKESLFSGVNNLEVYSLLSDEYSEHFGFTEVEIDEILKKANLTEKAEEIKQWYNGYQIGSTVIYNPLSIAKCIKQKGEMKAYWVNTSGNQLIKDLLKKSSLELRKDFESLLNGKLLDAYVSEYLVFQYLDGNPDAIWSLLLMSGYLRPVSSQVMGQRVHCSLVIPNREVYELYREIVEEWLSDGYSIKLYYSFINSLLTGDIEEFKKHLKKIMLQIVSYHDMATEPEAFYQGLMLGFTASLHSEGNYEIKSNRESGLGRFDIMLIPKDINKLGIILELKAAKDNESLEEAAIKALLQIDEKRYIEEMKSRGIKQSIKIGIGFLGKAFKLRYTREPEGIN